VRSRWLIVLPVVTIMLALDQWSKSLARDHLAGLAAPRQVAPFLELELVHNTGVAFSLLADHRAVIIGVTVLILIILALVARRTPAHDTLTLVGTSLVASGALGNIFDRIRMSYVTDFIHLPNWPTFNVADIAICTGVALIAWRQWKPMRDPVVST